MAQTAKMGGQTALLRYCIRRHYLYFCDGTDTAKNGGNSCNGDESWFTCSLSDLALIPFYIYSIVYFMMVAVFKWWRDIYNIMKYLPAPAAIIVMYAFAFLLTFSLRLARNYFSHKVSKKLSLDLLGIENLPAYYDAYVAISQLCSLYPINNDELTVPLDLINKICEICPDLSYKEAIQLYVDISQEKDKRNR